MDKIHEDAHKQRMTALKFSNYTWVPFRAEVLFQHYDRFILAARQYDGNQPGNARLLNIIYLN
jgi:hypothetical protein